MSKFNYFKNILVDGYDFPTVPQVKMDFNSQGIALLNLGTKIAEYSFNGTDLHGTLDPSNPSRGIIFDARVESKIFFRATQDGYGMRIRVECWAP